MTTANNTTATAEKYETIGKRLFDLVSPWDRDYAQPAEMAENARKSPEDVILYLLDYIDRMEG